MAIFVHHHDLPADLDLGHEVAVDTELMGLKHGRDRLCVVQLSSGNGDAHLVTFDGTDYSAPRLRALLADPAVLKIFHFARFDIGAIKQNLGVLCAPVYCTKTASRLARTFTEHHSLKTLCREMLGVDLDKQHGSSDWGNLPLTPAQSAYAASDVLHLHKLREKLDAMLAREDRTHLLQPCLDFLPYRALLDLSGWEEDIFAHHI